MHRRDAHHMLALQMGNHRGVIDGLERLPGAVTAFHLRKLADTGDELVRAGWGMPWRARLLADEARRVEVRTTAEELTEQFHLVGWRAGGNPGSGSGTTGRGVASSAASSFRSASILAVAAVRCASIRSRSDSAFASSVTSRGPRSGGRDIRKLFVVGRFHGVRGNAPVAT